MSVAVTFPRDAYTDLGSLAPIDVGFDLRLHAMEAQLAINAASKGLYLIRAGSRGNPQRTLEIVGESTYILAELRKLGYAIREAE